MYLIHAPFQLMSDNQNVEGVEELSILVVRDGSAGGSNKIPMQMIESYKKYDLVINISSNLILFQTLQTLLIAFLFWLNRVVVSDLNLGESKSLHSRLTLFLLNVKNVSIIDDGAASLNYYTFDHSGIIERSDSILRSWSYRKFYTTKRLTLKTFLDVPDSSGFFVKKYSFSDLTFRSSLALSYPSGGVMFLGAAFVEKGVMSESVYSDLCRSLIADMPETYIGYSPHRAERIEKIRSIVLETRFIMLEPTLPIELELLNLQRIPQKIITFQSAAVLTIAALFPSIEITLIRVGRENFLSRNSKEERAVTEMEGFAQYLERYALNTISV